MKTILQCICLKCVKILVDKDKDLVKNLKNKKEKYRLKEMREITKNVNYCHHCGTPVPSVIKEIKVTFLE